MTSQKTKVVERLYEVLQSRGSMIADNQDVSAAIAYCVDNFGVKLKKDSNPYNFMKDLLRGPYANQNWPSALIASRITARQLVGAGQIMEFVPFEDGQSEPFPNPFELTDELGPVRLQSISIPLTTKSLGRTDESWLIQVAVKLRVIEQHLALHSPLKWRELVHLQVAVKLGGASEIDALFLGVVELDGEQCNVLVTCEAKQERDPLLGEQIIRQIRAAFNSVEQLGLNVPLVVPVGIKSIRDVGVYVVEFHHWTSVQANDPDDSDLAMASRGLYQLSPMVPGVGTKATVRRRKAKKPAV